MSTEVVPVVPAPGLVNQLYAELEQKILALRPKEDLTLLEKAFHRAVDAHKNQMRVSGEPYMIHPLHVTMILADMQMDMVCLITGLLHDTVEDTSLGLEQIKKEFGPEVAACVDGVTKLSKLKLYSREERQAESVRKMLLAMVNDIRVIIVKLADRLHNMRTLDALPRERQLRIAQETAEIYAPIAHRLGMGKVRGELEDLSFRYLEPDAWADLMREIESQRQQNEEYLNKMRHDVEVNLRRENIPVRVEARIKRPYSVFQKMRRQKIALDQVYDLLALRIITDSVKNCYAALGVIHNEWHPIPGRIKDFIAIPRPNLYQSLHTSVIGAGGRSFEIQIRTDEMHRLAEEGIAAHWKYKEGRKGPGADDQRINWLRQLVEWQQEMRDPGEFISTLKVDLYPEEVYTFTPMGKVIALPREATPIDFAYAIHSDVGNTCVGAKVNGRIVQLKYNLKNGDVVEILTQTGHMPSKDWLGMVKTPRARNKIKHVINATEHAKAIEIGQKYLEREARRLGVQLSRDHQGGSGAGSQRIWLRQGGGFARGARLRQVFRAASAAEPGAGRGGGAGGGSAQAGACAIRTWRARGCSGRPRRPGDQGEGRRRSAGVSRQMLQPHPGRSHRGIRDARQRHRGAFQELHQRSEPDVRGGAQDRRGMGARGHRNISSARGGSYRRPAGDAEPAHFCPGGRAEQYPQPGSQF